MTSQENDNKTTVNIKTIPISPELQELLHSKTIASQFPVTFDNNAVWTGMQFYCIACKDVIDDDLVCGRISWPTPKTAVIDAGGICEKCNLVTTFFYRLHSDMRITTTRNGKWVAWHPEKESMISKILQRLTSALLPRRNNK